MKAECDARAPLQPGHQCLGCPVINGSPIAPTSAVSVYGVDRFRGVSTT